MASKIIERVSCGVHYGVDPTTPSDIFLDEETLKLIKENGHELSISGVCDYLRTIQPTFSPVLLSWNMTSRCNFDCKFCYIKDNSLNDEISFINSQKALNDLISEGLFEAYLSGGECLLIKDFIDIYTFLKKKGVFVTVFTNGSLINDELLECWRKFPPSSIEITLYSNDFFSKPYINIFKLREMGLHVVVKFTLASSTISFFDDVKKWSIENDIELVVDTELLDGNDTQHQNIEARYAISIDQKKSLNPNRYKNIKTSKAVRTALPCRSKHGIVNISPDFSLALCSKMNLRWSLNEVNVRDAIYELQQLIYKYENAKLHGCEGCAYSKMCDMCFATAINIGEELYVPDGYCKKVIEKYSKFALVK